MATKRMFSKEITNSDIFLDMPNSTQSLYFHLGMNADDDGFVSPRSIMRLCGSNDDDLGILIAKGFLIRFEDFVVVITHWKVNNEIKADRKKPSIYQEHLKNLRLTEGKSYQCIQNVSKMSPQYRLVENRLVENSIDTMSDKSDDSFERFWSIYPKKEKKKTTKDIWSRKKLNLKVEEIVAFVEKARATDRWKKGFVKQPTAFLNGECWNDDLSAYNDKFSAKSRANNVLETPGGKYDKY
jgi:hypothetical protein